MPHLYKNTFFVLDFDRTLVDTDRIHTVLEAVIERETNITAGNVRSAKQEAESRGDTFDTIGFVHHALTTQQSVVSWQHIQRQFIAESLNQDLLEPSARTLLDILDEHGIPYGIITYGTEAWQLAKLEAVGLFEVPHLVTQIKEKGKLLEGWKHGNETFIIPPAMTRDFQPIVAEAIVFLDDKAVSFQDIPPGVRGVLIRSPNGELLPSQRGVLPASVASVTGLDGAIELLFPS
jgi:phosphoserine phosphatase